MNVVEDPLRASIEPQKVKRNPFKQGQTQISLENHPYYYTQSKLHSFEDFAYMNCPKFPHRILTRNNEVIQQNSNLRKKFENL